MCTLYDVYLIYQKQKFFSSFILFFQFFRLRFGVFFSYFRKTRMVGCRLVSVCVWGAIQKNLNQFLAHTRALFCAVVVFRFLLSPSNSLHLESPKTKTKNCRKHHKRKTHSRTLSLCRLFCRFVINQRKMSTPITITSTHFVCVVLDVDCYKGVLIMKNFRIIIFCSFPGKARIQPIFILCSSCALFRTSSRKRTIKTSVFRVNLCFYFEIINLNLRKQRQTRVMTNKN